jgi:hypothetical protein
VLDLIDFRSPTDFGSLFLLGGQLNHRDLSVNRENNILYSGDDKWMRIERVENAIDNLQMTVHFLKSFSGIKKWKWAVIALHQTLYSFFIVALVSCGKKVVKGKHLITIIDAAKMLGETKNLSMQGNAKPLIMVDEQAAAFVALVKMLRNNFEHFNTDHWSVETSMFNDIFEKMTPVVRFMVLESNTIRFTEEQETEVKNYISQLEILVLRDSTN